MRKHALGLAASALILGGMTGCGGGAIQRSAVGAAPSSNATATLDSEHLGRGSVDLLDAIRGRVRGMQIRENSSDCPEITFRGTKSASGENSPIVYVDGIRATNTCILTTLHPGDVERVEAYSAGVAPRPPYQAHPNGLIIVIMQDRPTD